MFADEEDEFGFMETKVCTVLKFINHFFLVYHNYEDQLIF